MSVGIFSYMLVLYNMHNNSEQEFPGQEGYLHDRIS